MKIFILEYKWYAQKFSHQLLRFMQKFVLEEYLEIMCSEAGEEMDDLMLLARDNFISAMLRNDAENSSKMEIVDLKC